MRIALMSTAEFTAPPLPDIIFAPLALIAKQANGLVDMGHDVTLLAAEGSVSNAPIISNGLQPLKEHEKIIEKLEGVEERERRNSLIGMCDQSLLTKLYGMAQEGAFDIVHLHPSIVHNCIPFASHASVPTVITLHDPPDSLWQHLLSPRRGNVPQLNLVTISEAQQRGLRGVKAAATVHNGIDVMDYPFRKDAGDFLLFAGRLVPEKGADVAVRVAIKANETLKITGGRIDQGYFDRTVRPFLGRQIQFLGMVKHDQLYRVYGNAKALLFPIDWEEPFGLGLIEAMACGIPVIAFRKGSVPEIVVDGKTGFIVDDEDGMVQAISRIGEIDRVECRKHVESNFPMSRMVADYSALYKRIVDSLEGPFLGASAMLEYEPVTPSGRRH